VGIVHTVKVRACVRACICACVCVYLCAQFYYTIGSLYQYNKLCREIISNSTASLPYFIHMRNLTKYEYCMYTYPAHSVSKVEVMFQETMLYEWSEHWNSDVLLKLGRLEINSQSTSLCAQVCKPARYIRSK
jgi:hypothetical protein